MKQSHNFHNALEKLIASGEPVSQPPAVSAKRLAPLGPGRGPRGPAVGSSGSV